MLNRLAPVALGTTAIGCCVAAFVLTLLDWIYSPSAAAPPPSDEDIEPFDLGPDPALTVDRCLLDPPGNDERPWPYSGAHRAERG